MEREEFERIVGNEKFSTTFKDLKKDNALVGLNIIAKYLPTKGIEASEHDKIYSVYVDEILEAGITVEDAKYLRAINWMIDEDSLACFV